MTSPYSRFKKENLILRDELAIDRTLLANERTCLAYLRSGVALVLSGVTFIHFAQDPWFRTLGILCLPAGTITVIIGAVRYRIMNSRIASARNQSDPETVAAKQKHDGP